MANAQTTYNYKGTIRSNTLQWWQLWWKLWKNNWEKEEVIASTEWESLWEQPLAHRVPPSNAAVATLIASALGPSITPSRPLLTRGICSGESEYTRLSTAQLAPFTKFDTHTYISHSIAIYPPLH